MQRNSTKINAHIIMGRHAVEEVLEHASERIEEVYIADSQNSRSGRFASIIGKLEKQRVDIHYVGSHELTKIANSESHQAIVARLSPRQSLSLDALLSKLKTKERSLLLMLDSIEDPHNFGSILRSAECFGVDGVIWSKNRGCDVTPTVTKVSVGASELLNLVPVSNLHSIVKTLKEEGFWLVGSLLDKDATSLNDFKFPEKTVLVLGSEESGIQQLLIKELDFKVYIPMKGRIQSLNVSQAAAVLLGAAGIS